MPRLINTAGCSGSETSILNCPRAALTPRANNLRANNLSGGNYYGGYEVMITCGGDVDNTVTAAYSGGAGEGDVCNVQNAELLHGGRGNWKWVCASGCCMDVSPSTHLGVCTDVRVWHPSPGACACAASAEINAPPYRHLLPPHLRVDIA